MAKTTHSPAQYSIQISSEAPITGGMTAWALRDFVRALDAAGIPDDASIIDEHNHDTRHLIRLYVTHFVTVDRTEEAPDA